MSRAAAELAPKGGGGAMLCPLGDRLLGDRVVPEPRPDWGPMEMRLRPAPKARPVGRNHGRHHPGTGPGACGPATPALPPTAAQLPCPTETKRGNRPCGSRTAVIL